VHQNDHCQFSFGLLSDNFLGNGTHGSMPLQIPSRLSLQVCCGILVWLLFLGTPFEISSSLEVLLIKLDEHKKIGEDSITAILPNEYMLKN
jgi:hypothetical protein